MNFSYPLCPEPFLSSIVFIFNSLGGIDIRHLGTLLGSSRGGFDCERIIESILEHNITQVYVIGGDGTHRGADILFNEICKRRLKISIIGGRLHRNCSITIRILTLFIQFPRRSTMTLVSLTARSASTRPSNRLRRLLHQPGWKLCAVPMYPTSIEHFLPFILICYCIACRVSGWLN